MSEPVQDATIITQEPENVGAPGNPATDPASLDQVLSERGSRYGVFLEQADVSHKLRQTLFQRLGERGITTQMGPDQVEALIMVAHKLARIVNGDPNYSDSWRDIAGYATLVANRLEGRAQ